MNDPRWHKKPEKLEVDESEAPTEISHHRDTIYALIRTFEITVRMQFEPVPEDISVENTDYLILLPQHEAHLKKIEEECVTRLDKLAGQPRTDENMTRYCTTWFEIQIASALLNHQRVSVSELINQIEKAFQRNFPHEPMDKWRAILFTRIGVMRNHASFGGTNIMPRPQRKD